MTLARDLGLEDLNLTDEANTDMVREETSHSSQLLLRQLGQGANTPVPCARPTTATSRVHAFAMSFSSPPASSQR